MFSQMSLQAEVQLSTFTSGIERASREQLEPDSANVKEACYAGDSHLEVFTTRPDTIFGATYMVIAPEHAQLGSLTTEEQRDSVQAYVQAAGQKSDLERTELQKQKTGVFTGSYSLSLFTPSQVLLGQVPITKASLPFCAFATMANCLDTMLSTLSNYIARSLNQD